MVRFCCFFYSKRAGSFKCRLPDFLVMFRQLDAYIFPRNNCLVQNFGVRPYIHVSKCHLVKKMGLRSFAMGDLILPLERDLLEKQARVALSQRQVV